MPEPRAQRTLVKSPPELWAEISDPGALTRHLGELGEIRITRTDPETTVAWEGDRVRGTVKLEASGWGTKVTLTAEAARPEPPAAPAVEEVAEPVAAPARATAPLPQPHWRVSLLALLRRRPRAAAIAAPQAVEGGPAEGSAEPRREAARALASRGEGAPTAASLEAVLVGVLDGLGSAQKRPFSR